MIKWCLKFKGNITSTINVLQKLNCFLIRNKEQEAQASGKQETAG